ncbi:MAG: hypothetical protein HY704_11855 [Gemmatimonadetes bacterium]|nr:hypothetical protein [Gemmatimonadota bacterium]
MLSAISVWREMTPTTPVATQCPAGRTVWQRGDSGVASTRNLPAPLAAVEEKAAGAAGAPLELRELGGSFIVDVRTLAASPVLTLTTDEGHLDLVDVVQGVGDYARAPRQSVDIAAGDLGFQALNLERLLKAKPAMRRPEDLEQVPELEALIARRRRRS